MADGTRWCCFDHVLVLAVGRLCVSLPQTFFFLLVNCQQELSNGPLSPTGSMETSMGAFADESSPDEVSSEDDVLDASASNNKKRKRVTKHQSRRAKPLTVEILYRIFEKLNIAKDSVSGTYKLVLPALKSAECSAMYFAVTEWQCFRKRIMNHGFEIVDEQQSAWIRVRANLATPEGVLVFEDLELRSRFGTPCKIKSARERGEIVELPAAPSMSSESPAESEREESDSDAELASLSGSDDVAASEVASSVSSSGSSSTLSASTSATSSAISISGGGQGRGAALNLGGGGLAFGFSSSGASPSHGLSSHQHLHRPMSPAHFSSSANSHMMVGSPSSPSTVSTFSPRLFGSGVTFGTPSSTSTASSFTTAIFTPRSSSLSLPSFSAFCAEMDQENSNHGISGSTNSSQHGADHSQTSSSSAMSGISSTSSSSSMDVDESLVEGALRTCLPLPIVARELLTSGHYSISNGQFDIHVTMKPTSATPSSPAGTAALGTSPAAGSLWGRSSVANASSSPLSGTLPRFSTFQQQGFNKSEQPSAAKFTVA